jgi:hypothetical protein
MADTNRVGSTPPGEVRQTISRAHDYKSAYAGNFRIRVTNLDVAITFISVVDFPDGVMGLQDEATMTMTFAAMKILSEHLAITVQAIEQELGPIRVPLAVRPSEQNRAQILQTIKSAPMGE